MSVMDKKDMSGDFQEAINPDEVINEMSELSNKVYNLDYSNIKEAKKQSREIIREIYRLAKLQVRQLKKL
jgi:hypothetical protein